MNADTVSVLENRILLLQDRIDRVKEELYDRMDVEDTDYGPRADFNMRMYMILEGSDRP